VTLAGEFVVRRERRPNALILVAAGADLMAQRPTTSEAPMRTARRHPRITGARDLRAKLRTSDVAPTADRVLNLSEGGMLIANNKLTVGHKTAFELTGSSFHYAGVAEVVHLTNETAGLRFLSWQGHDDRPVRSLIEQSSQWHTPSAEAQQDQPVIRRVAVLTGHRRPARQGTPPEAKPAS
jgi:hypothetical protein